LLDRPIKSCCPLDGMATLGISEKGARSESVDAVRTMPGRVTAGICDGRGEDDACSMVVELVGTGVGYAGIARFLALGWSSSNLLFLDGKAGDEERGSNAGRRAGRRGGRSSSAGVGIEAWGEMLGGNRSGELLACLNASIFDFSSFVSSSSSIKRV
jgi:hypothetical protein